MDKKTRLASQALVAISAHVAMAMPSGRDLQMWRQELRDLLPDCAGCPERMVPVKASAEWLVAASGATEIANALARLQREVKVYYALTAGDRIEIWRECKREVAA
ncbi:hypothetical protein [Roseovarius pacificus]|uniref:hypothetical protein n=1 Tax=Roseovarius pacificus TaxID=337701 RepID=UPI002A186AE8|nr:hypothetical protein [Roseovarius pacificus]